MSIIFAFPGYETFACKMRDQTGFLLGSLAINRFPDGESLVTLKTDVKNKDVIVVCGLDNVDDKIMPLMFFTHLAREFGAKRVGLVAPYLGYMRQDRRFHPGQAITSVIFSKYLSSLVDLLVTLDPHLHRHKSLDEIYMIPTVVLHAREEIGKWIKTNVKNPVIVGPDEESRQWVKDVAEKIQVPFIVLEKIRHGDRDVKVSVPDVGAYRDYTPILVDDIISTAQTMIETVKHLHKAAMKPPVCIGIHAIFAGEAYSRLKNAGVAKIATTNTVLHETNEIDVTSLFSCALKGNGEK